MKEQPAPSPSSHHEKSASDHVSKGQAHKARLFCSLVPGVPQASIAPSDVLAYALQASKTFLMEKILSVFGAPRRCRPSHVVTASISLPRPPFRGRRPRRRDDRAHMRAVDLLRSAGGREKRLYDAYDAQMREFAGIKADLAEVKRLQQKHPEMLAGMAEEWLAEKSCRGQNRSYAEAEL